MLIVAASIPVMRHRQVRRGKREDLSHLALPSTSQTPLYALTPDGRGQSHNNPARRLRNPEQVGRYAEESGSAGSRDDWCRDRRSRRPASRNESVDDPP